MLQRDINRAGGWGVMEVEVAVKSRVFKEGLSEKHISVKI